MSRLKTAKPQAVLARIRRLNAVIAEGDSPMKSRLESDKWRSSGWREWRNKLILTVSLPSIFKEETIYCYNTAEMQEAEKPTSR